MRYSGSVSVEYLYVKKEGRGRKRESGRERRCESEIKYIYTYTILAVVHLSATFRDYRALAVARTSSLSPSGRYTVRAIEKIRHDDYNSKI